jgi:hypothetical protein
MLLLVGNRFHYHVDVPSVLHGIQDPAVFLNCCQLPEYGLLYSLAVGFRALDFHLWRFRQNLARDFTIDGAEQLIVFHLISDNAFYDRLILFRSHF